MAGSAFEKKGFKKINEFDRRNVSRPTAWYVTKPQLDREVFHR